MSVAYLDPEIQLKGGRGVQVEFTIRNDSEETWRAAEGFAIGYQLFDADTATVIVDGQRVRLGEDLCRGESARVRLAFELPGEDGRYQAIISPMREDVCWYYERGWPFLLIDGRTAGGGALVGSLRVATRSVLRSRRAMRGAGRAFTYPLLTIWRNLGLIRTMVRRDIVGRYRGSFAGIFWTLIHPLLLMLTYFFVFGIVLRTRFPGDPSRSGFALNFLAGMLPWLAFSEAAGRSPTVMLEHRNFVKKLVFAVETLPVNLVAAGLMSELFAIVVFCAFLLAARGTLYFSILWLPALLVPQFLFTTGVAWFLAALGVFVRDLGQIIGFVLTLWFFVTPICYPEASLPPALLPLLSKNPIYVLVQGYRAIFLQNHAPGFAPLWKLWIASGAVFVLGHAWFYKLRRSFPDLI